MFPVIFKLVFLGAIPWQGGEQVPSSRATSTTRGVALCLFPCRQHHSQTPPRLSHSSSQTAPQYLQVKGLILPAVLRSSPHSAPTLRGRWQLSAGRDRGIPCSRAAKGSKDRGAQPLSTATAPARTDTAPARAQSSQERRRTQGRGDACTSLHIRRHKKINQPALGCKQPLGFIKSTLHVKTEEVSYHRGTEGDEHLRRGSRPAFAWR